MVQKLLMNIAGRFRGSEGKIFYFRFYVTVVMLVWTFLGAFVFIRGKDMYKAQTREIAHSTALASFKKDQAFRFWASTHGGVYVPVSEKTQPNPYLKGDFEKNIVTAKGRALTLMNPAYMLRQMMQDFSDLYGVRGHLRSLKPLNKDNYPDDWEKTALENFERGVSECSEISVIDGKKYFRFMRPMIVQEGCLKCHEHQGYKVGDIRGGVGIAFPLKDLLEREGNQIYYHGLVVFAFWLVGAVIFIYGFLMIRNRIVEREKAEFKLRRAHEQLDATISALPDLMLEFDSDGRIVSFNTPDESILYVEPKVFLGKTIEDVLPPEAGMKFSESLERAAKGELVYGVIYSLDMPDKVRWYELSAARVENRDNAYHNIICLIRDVTLWIEAEHNLKESENKYRALVENIPYVTWITDNQRRISYVSPNVENVLGFTAKQICENSLEYMYNRIHPDDKDKLKADWNKLFSYGENVDSEFRIRNRDDEWILLSNRAVNVYLEKGIYYAYCIFSDITEQRAIENRLKQSEKLEAIGQLAGGLAHDFNNQLGGIIGFADLLMDRGIEDPFIKEYSGKIINCAQHVANLTGQLLSFARLGNYFSVPVDLHTIIDEVISMLSHSIDKKIAIKKGFNAPVSCVKGDPSQLQSAILNIAINARDAMPDGGVLEFTTDVVYLDEEYCSTHEYEVIPGEFVQVSIADTGIGIDDKIRKHIFEPFFTTKEFGKGTGMGLAAVYGTVKSHKGAIYVYSEIDNGTVFKLSFPLEKDKQPDYTDKESDIEITKGEGRIMLVDDEEIIIELGKRVLSNLGYEVLVCRNGPEAIEVYRKNRESINLAIIDIVMPKMNGGEVLRKLKEINPEIKAIMSSGYSENGCARIAGSEGALGFIQKPYRIAEMSRMISKVMKPDIS